MEKQLQAKKTKTFYGHLCDKRIDATKVFPHCGHNAADYIERINGAKLSEDSVKALGRAQQ